MAKIESQTVLQTVLPLADSISVAIANRPSPIGLFWLQSTIQSLALPYFFMHDNISAMIDKQN
jgi:hypothetical protein